jgi:hypothetical protein
MASADFAAVESRGEFEFDSRDEKTRSTFFIVVFSTSNKSLETLE